VRRGPWWDGLGSRLFGGDCCFSSVWRSLRFRSGRRLPTPPSARSVVIPMLPVPARLCSLTRITSAGRSRADRQLLVSVFLNSRPNASDPNVRDTISLQTGAADHDLNESATVFTGTVGSPSPRPPLPTSKDQCRNGLAELPPVQEPGGLRELRRIGRQEPVRPVVALLLRSHTSRTTARRSASARTPSSDVATVCSQDGATRSPHHVPSRHRSVPSSPV